MSDETVSVVVCHEGTPSNTYRLHETDLQVVMETIGRVVSWRSLEDKVSEALRALDDGCLGQDFEAHRGRHVGDWDLVVRIDMTVDKDIVITLEGGQAPA